MKILVTGANGFIGRNLVSQLRNKGYSEIYEYDADSAPESLSQYTRDCEFVFHLAGVNRPKDENEFMKGNFGFTSRLLDELKSAGNKAPVLITSSIQAALNNAYGKSKKAGEDLLLQYGRDNGVKTYVYRLNNVFGKWCRPNYNSVVATFCSNIANNLEIAVNNRDTVMNLVYIDDVVEEFIGALEGKPKAGEDGFFHVPKVHTVKLGEIADRLYAFKASRESLIIPSLENEFDRELYATFLTYLPDNGFDYPLEMKCDDRGWLAEFIKSKSMGQIFISKTKPGVTRGNHWHHTKVEKFLVVQGEAVIAFRKIGGSEKQEYKVSGDDLRVVDIPAGYTHSITNIGENELIAIFWADEIFDPDKPDTYAASADPSSRKAEN